MVWFTYRELEVYFMDTQIWYAIFSTLFGGIHGAFSHLGEIRTLGMLRSRFTEVQPAFNELLVPLPIEDSRREHQDESIQMNNTANFSRVWNTFIDSMREEDLINDEEKDLLRVPIPYFASDVSVPQLPPFLLASKLKEYEDVDAFKSQIINVLQDILEINIQDVMVHGHDVLERAHPAIVDAQNSKEQRFGKINIGLTKNPSWKDEVVRLLLLLTTKESAINAPSNDEARRRLTFFANFLVYEIATCSKSPRHALLQNQVLYSDEELKELNEDGISTLFYLQTIYNDEWKYFEERTSKYTEKEKIEARRQWVSYRGQTLARTVGRMMYYRKALELQCSLEATGENENIEYSEQDQIPQANDLSQALVDLKFTYVVTCQIYGKQKKSTVKKDRSFYLNILNLMSDYPSLRVAYIDEREKMVNGKSQKISYSVLVKVVDRMEEEIYRIKLQGDPAAIGEWKPENHNHAIIFTRGEALQAIDMNQGNYFEEAFKMRNVLQEFLVPRHGPRKPTVLGLREHIFTGSVSTLAGFMSNQERSSVTIGKRILADPLT